MLGTSASVGTRSTGASVVNRDTRPTICAAVKSSSTLDRLNPSGRKERMKRNIRILGVALLAIAAVATAGAQTATKTLAPPTASMRAVKPVLAAISGPTVHQNTLTWGASSDATATDLANVYSVAGGCPSGTLTTSQFTLLKSGLAPSGPFVDGAVSPGKTKSYVVTNVIGGVETGVSNCVSGTTPTFPPQGAQVSSQ